LLNFRHAFRESERYGKDVEALLGEVSRRFPVAEWTFVGTSEGSVSALHAARMNPDVVRRLILTASLFVPTRMWLIRRRHCKRSLALTAAPSV
jgi:alpha-beta hydrolase superfamily lysophospholipase